MHNPARFPRWLTLFFALGAALRADQTIQCSLVNAGVLPHPFYAVSNDQGVFEIKNLPPGNYVIEAWQGGALRAAG